MWRQYYWSPWTKCVILCSSWVNVTVSYVVPETIQIRIRCWEWFWLVVKRLVQKIYTNWKRSSLAIDANIWTYESECRLWLCWGLPVRWLCWRQNVTNVIAKIYCFYIHNSTDLSKVSNFRRLFRKICITEF
jgi:hypothetical protein